MSVSDWLVVVDAAAAAVLSAGFVWLGSLAWADLRKPAAPVRRAGHYGERAE